MQSHIPVALGGRPSPFAVPLHHASAPESSRPPSASVPSQFTQSSTAHLPLGQSSAGHSPFTHSSSSGASRDISPRLSHGTTPADARPPALPTARPDHLHAPSINGTSTGLGTVTAVPPTNDDIEAVIQLAMASSPAGSASGKDTRTQLFVGNLPYRVRWQDLKDLFRRAGTVLRADVALGPDNRSRGHGTVLLASQEDAERAINMFQGWCWQGRVLEVRKDRVITGEEGMGLGPGSVVGSGLPSPIGTGGIGSGLASPAPLSRLNSSVGYDIDDSLSASLSGGLSRPSTGNGVGLSVSRNLFVGNLPFHIQWQDLKDLFRQAGAVTRADVALGADGRSRGFGTVSFSNEQDAERAVRMFNGYDYNGRVLKVHFDKFSAPASTAQLAVPPLSASAPHSPSTIAIQQHPFQGQLSFGHQGASFAQQLLQRQNNQQPSMQPSRQGSDAFAYSPYDEQRKSDILGSTPDPPHPQDMHISVPYSFEFLSSGPSTPYDWYTDSGGMRFGPSAEQAQALQTSVLGTWVDVSGGREGLAGGSTGAAVEAAVMQESRQGREKEEPHRPPPLALAHSHLSSGLSSKPSSKEQEPAFSQCQTQSQSQSQSPSHSQSHSTPHQHPAHPGPISLPPPPPVTAFPVPPAHTLSPPYYSPLMHPGHPQSPYHHPAMAMGMTMTPHGLPPITPSMPSFSFAPQPSPIPQDPNAPNLITTNSGPAQKQPSPFDPARTHMAHAHGHIMPPFSPFSPGVTMSPGTFWGRPGSSAVNPFINPTVGAPVHHGSPGYYWPPRGPAVEEGYFPPVAPQPQPEGSYFPHVPPAGSRPSGLANELGRGDSGNGSGSSEPTDSVSEGLSAADASKPEDGRLRSGTSGDSEATTTETLATDASRSGSSQGTSCQTDVGSEDSGMVALERDIGALAVANNDQHGAGGEQAKPRAYSAQAGIAAHTPLLARAGSDPLDVRPGSDHAVATGAGESR